MNNDFSILVIEDNRLNLELIVDLLSSAGFGVFTADNAEQGLQLAAARQPSLILMDISLPGTDGLEATKALKSNPLTAHLPVVALTAHAMSGDEDKARQAGCCAYLTKPINTRELNKQISCILKHVSDQPPDCGQPVPGHKQ